MSSNGLWAALLEIVLVSSQCRNFWQDGLEFSRKWRKIVADISNPETSAIGLSRSRLALQIGCLDSHCEESLNQAKAVLASAQRSLGSVGEGEPADSNDLDLLEPWRDSIVQERSEGRTEKGASTPSPGYLGKELRELGREMFTAAELDSTLKPDFLRTRSNVIAIWLGKVDASEPIFGILSEIRITLVDFLRILDDQPEWNRAIGAMEERLGMHDSQILGLESEVQSLRREKIIEWGG